MPDIDLVVHLGNGTHVPLALITGSSRGLGLALAHGLARRGWDLLLDARTPGPLADAATALPAERVTTLAGDVTDPDHRAELVRQVRAEGRLELLVTNASTLPASPQPTLAQLDTADLERTLAVNLVAPHALVRDLLPALRAASGTVVTVSSDAAIGAYPGWGAYGASKAALDHLARTVAAEEPDLRAYAVDPGDLRTRLHQEAFPDEDISDRPEPTTVVPALLALLAQRPPSGRYRLAEVAQAGVA